ncbi:hypothetical protein KIPB_013495, partial [Kipferlia bialata]|eukprot:g13495.t1
MVADNSVTGLVLSSFDTWLKDRLHVIGFPEEVVEANQELLKKFVLFVDDCDHFFVYKNTVDADTVEFVVSPTLNVRSMQYPIFYIYRVVYEPLSDPKMFESAFNH